jgi:mannosylglycerate hydrolase
MDDLLDQLEQDPQLRFLLDGQTVLLEDYLAVRPAARDRIERLTTGGQLSLGPWYVLADELLAGDEPLVRNLLLGRRIAAGFGGCLEIGYSPDAFGHPAALPTILRGFGIDRAVVWRGFGGEPGQEKDLFNWVGPDGAQVLTYHLPPHGYEFGAELPVSRAGLAERWRAMERALGSRATVPVLLVLNGADHHALQPDLPKVISLLNDTTEDHDFSIGTLEDFLELLQHALHSADQHPPQVEGELRFSYRYTWTLQGTHSTRADLKQAVWRGAQLLTRWAEPQTTLAMVGGGGGRRALLNAAWRSHLKNLSHDVLGGCCADDVAADALARARKVETEARGILEDALHERLRQDRVQARRRHQEWNPSVVLINPSAEQRGGVAEVTVTRFLSDVVVGKPSPKRGAPVEAAKPFHLVDDAGKTVPMQILSDYQAFERLDSPRDYPDQDRVQAYQIAVAAPAVPSLGLLRLDVRDGKPADRTQGVSVEGAAMVTEWGSVDAGPPDAFAVAWDGKPRAAGLGQLVSDLDCGDSYTFEPGPDAATIKAQWGVPRVIWRGPLVVAVAREFTIPGRARGTVFARVDAGSTLLRLIVEGENVSGNHRLRLLVPLGRRVSHTTADMLYGPTERPVPTPVDPKEFPRERPVATAPFQRFVSAGKYTVFARGLHEYEVTADWALAVTIFRAVGDLSRGELEMRPGHAGWPTPVKGAQQLGRFRAELAVAPLSVRPSSPPESWAEVERAAEAFHAPLAGMMLRYGIEVPTSVDGPGISGAGMAFKALKPREDGAGFVLRCVNLCGVKRRGRLHWPTPLARVFRARMDETVIEEAQLGGDRRQVVFEAGPREVITLVVEC